MKCRKLKAVLAAVSAIAVLATAATGFAATITTVTTYNLVDTDAYAQVTTTVSGLVDTDAEVTLLVSAPGAGVNGSGISYIDQKAASNGTAEFTYQLDKVALSDATAAVVTSGNDAGEDTTAGNLGVTVLNDVTTTEYTITFAEDAYGAGDENVTASVVAASGYEITAVAVDGNAVDSWNSFSVAKEDIDKIVVTAQKVVTTPEVTDVVSIAVANAAGKYENTTVMKLVNAQPTTVGVIYDNVFYPAMAGVAVDGTFAVQLIADTDITAGITTFVE